MHCWTKTTPLDGHPTIHTQRSWKVGLGFFLSYDLCNPIPYLLQCPLYLPPIRFRQKPLPWTQYWPSFMAKRSQDWPRAQIATKPLMLYAIVLLSCCLPGISGQATVHRLFTVSPSCEEVPTNDVNDYFSDALALFKSVESAVTRLSVATNFARFQETQQSAHNAFGLDWPESYAQGQTAGLHAEDQTKLQKARTQIAYAKKLFQTGNGPPDSKVQLKPTTAYLACSSTEEDYIRTTMAADIDARVPRGVDTQTAFGFSEMYYVPPAPGVRHMFTVNRKQNPKHARVLHCDSCVSSSSHANSTFCREGHTGVPVLPT